MKPQSVNQAINAAAELWGCEPWHLTGPEKTMRHVGPRHALAWWLHVRLGISLSNIARKLGARHHTSILHSCRAVSEALAAKRPNKRHAYLARCARELDEAWRIDAPPPVLYPREEPIARPAFKAKPRKPQYEPGFPKQKPCIAGCGTTVTLKTRNDRRKCARCHHNHAGLDHLEGVAA